MKALNKFFYALLALATVGMVACDEVSTYEPGAPEVEGCYDVYFPDAATLETQGPVGDVELDPADATVFTYTAYRSNTEGAVTVPVVVSTNTDDKFTVSEIIFEDGSDVAEFNVTLNESEIGVAYTLAFSIDDPQYVKQYESKNTNSISITVTRVKWNDVGECTYTDDIVTGWYGFTFSGEWAGQKHPTYKVQVQVRADSIDEAAFQAALAGTGSDAGLAGIYRLVNPYRVGPWGDPDDPSLTAVPNYIVINAEAIDKVYIPHQALGMDHIIADMTVMSEAYYQMTYASEPENIDGMWGTIKGGTLTFMPGMLCGSPGGSYAGKIYNTNADGAFALVISPALGSYELKMPADGEDGDFAFTEVELSEEALFYSESQSLVKEAVLEEGRPSVSTDDADRNYVAQYGLLYRLPDLYAEGYPIYFGATVEGVVTLHSDFEEQKTGLVQNGYDVYMAIDAKASKFNPETGELSLVADFYTYQGKYVVSYGVYNEIISTVSPEFPYAPAADLKADFEYSELFTDKFKSAFQDGEWAATLEVGTCTNSAAAATFAKTYGTAYRIPSAYVNGYDIFFVADEEGQVSVPAGYEIQATGTTIYGTPAYIKIKSGTMGKTGVTFSVEVCDRAGKALMPVLCNESLLTYNWIDVATGSYYSALEEEPTTGLTFQNAEDTNIYRIYDYLGTGKHMMFTWDSKTNKCEVMGMLDTGVDSSPYNGVGNFFVCDARNFYLWVGKDFSWEYLEENGYAQSYYDPEEKTFVFGLFYNCPALGVGVSLGYLNEAFVLDGEVAEPEWVEVGTGSYYSTLFIDAENYYVPFNGRKLMNLKDTNKYRVVDFTGAGKDFSFTWDKETNKCEISGYQDTGVDSAPMGGKGNIFACDVRSYYKANGFDLTWEELAAQIGGDAQPYFNPADGEFVFHVILACPELGPDVSLGGGNIFTDYFVLDAAQTASASSAKVASIANGATLKQHNFENVNKTAVKAKKIDSNVRFTYAAKELEPAKPAKQTPVKRPINQVETMTPRF